MSNVKKTIEDAEALSAASAWRYLVPHREYETYMQVTTEITKKYPRSPGRVRLSINGRVHCTFGPVASKKEWLWVVLLEPDKAQGSPRERTAGATSGLSATRELAESRRRYWVRQMGSDVIESLSQRVCLTSTVAWLRQDQCGEDAGMDQEGRFGTDGLDQRLKEAGLWRLSELRAQRAQVKTLCSRSGNRDSTYLRRRMQEIDTEMVIEEERLHQIFTELFPVAIWGGDGCSEVEEEEES